MSETPREQHEFEVTLEGPSDDVRAAVDALKDALVRARRAYPSVHFDYSHEDMTHVR